MMYMIFEVTEDKGYSSKHIKNVSTYKEVIAHIKAHNGMIVRGQTIDSETEAYFYEVMK